MCKRIVLICLFVLWALPALAQVHTAWVNRYDGPTEWNDCATDIAVDDWGNIYVVGGSRSQETDWDCAIVKYDPDGEALWSSVYSGPASGSDWPKAMAIDGLGNVCVAGPSDGESGEGADLGYLTLKYRPDGDTAWTRRYDGPGGDHDVASAIAIDASNNILVTGYSWGTGTCDDYATIKYDPDGNRLWVQRYNGCLDSTDEARAIAGDVMGNVYVTGTSLDTAITEAGVDSVSHYVTVKYDPDGNELWVRKYNGPGKGDDVATAITVDGSGNVYVTGRSYGGPATDYDFATVKYDPNGAELWVRRYTLPSSFLDYPRVIAADGAGNVYVTGQSEGNSSSYDYATVKYSSGGDELWVQRYDGNGDYDDIPFDMAIDTAANVYVTGTSAQGNHYPTNEDFITIKYDSSGSQIWLKQYDGPPGGQTDEATAIAVSSSGHVYVTGESNSTVAPSYDYDFATIEYFQGEVRGDANGDAVINVSDVIYLVNYLFRGGDPPEPIETGDVNCDETTDVADVLYLVNYLYRDGPLPCGI
jgi:hypothetical protein